MARGQQKIQSQQKAAKRAQDAKRAEGHDQKKAAQAALVHQCVVCKVSALSLIAEGCRDLLVYCDSNCNPILTAVANA